MIYLSVLSLLLLLPCAVQSTVTFNNIALNSEAMIIIFPSFLSFASPLHSPPLFDQKPYFKRIRRLLFRWAITFCPIINIPSYFLGSVLGLFRKRPEAVFFHTRRKGWRNMKQHEQFNWRKGWSKRGLGWLSSDVPVTEAESLAEMGAISLLLL